MANRRTRVFWGRSEMDKLLTWIETNKPDCIGHGRREDCVRIKNEVFFMRNDYTIKTIKEKLLNMEKKFKKAKELKYNNGTDIEVDKICPFFDRIAKIKRTVDQTAAGNANGGQSVSVGPGGSGPGSAAPNTNTGYFEDDQTGHSTPGPTPQAHIQIHSASVPPATVLPSSTTSLSSGSVSTGPIDFKGLLKILEDRERRLLNESTKRLELEKKRLELEQKRYKIEVEREKKIEQILYDLAHKR